MHAIGTNPQGETVYEHDGITEWADCALCGAHLDYASDSAVESAEAREISAEGGCYVCGAGAALVGLLHEE